MKFIHLISYLIPTKILYGLSSLMAFFASYREEVITKNLSNSFPDFDKDKIQQIKKQFYRNFFDFIVETLKLISISKKRVRKKVFPVNPEPFARELENSSVILLASHIFHWELQGLSLDLVTPSTVYFSYQPLSNPFFDRLMLRMRTRLGPKGMPRDKMVRTLMKRKDEKAIFYILPDQSPAGNALRYRTMFLNQETAFYYSIGQLISKMKLPVWAIHSEKISRGKYKIVFTRLCEANSGVSPEDALEKYAAYLEGVINKNPNSWLWSHNRWKRPRRKDDIYSHKITNHEG